MFRTVPLSIIRSSSLYTQQWYMSYRLADSLWAGSGRNWFRPDPVSKSVRHAPLLCAQCKTPDDGQRNYPKHAEFYSKNKFEKLENLVDFTIRIYHGARSPERQIYRKWPKHVEFYSKNKFEKLVYVVGFIVSIYHDARSPERQKRKKAVTPSPQ